MSSSKRKRVKPPTPLGVLEFSSALNGDDPLLILKKLRQFVNVVGYERRLALSPDEIQVDGVSSGDDDASGDEDDDDSFLSFDDELDETEPSFKRQKLNAGTSKKTPAWKLDQKNYQVPFVGTSVSKGPTGSVTPNVWPTGFLEEYRKHSPSGVELIKNDFISAVPPGGIHKSLCKESDIFGLNDDGKRRMGKKVGGGGQTRGQIISISLQSNYWMALSEWILGFVSSSILRKELIWEDGGLDDFASDGAAGGDKGDKCAVPPPIMTILMKQRLPEWIDAIHNYTRQQQYYAQQRQKERQQQKKQNQKKQQQQRKGDQHQVQQQESQRQHDVKNEEKQLQIQRRQQREETLLLAALHNLIALCHISNGTAREVLRKVTAVTGSTSTAKVGGAGNSAKGGKFVGKAPGSVAGDGTSWMVQLFQQQHQRTSSSPLPHEPQMQCLRLVCTLLETNDYNILSRLAEVPAWLLKQGASKSSKGSSSGGGEKNFGLAYIALRYGIQNLVELGKRQDGGNDEEERDDYIQEQIDAYARHVTRLVRVIRETLLPPPTSVGECADGKNDGAGGGKRGFVLGIGATAELLSGEVLNNLTKLSQVAPPFDVDAESIQSIIDGDDSYEDLSPIEAASVESRRLLLLLLADKNRSPFLYDIHHKAWVRVAQCTKIEEQSSIYLSQLSKALYGMVANQGHDLSMKTFLGMCLRTTPELMPHFFRLLQLSDPRPTYRSLAALTFVEGVLREAPTPPLHVQGKLIPIEQIQSAIIPSCVTKNILGKVVQSQSALMVSSGLKLIITILRRAHDCISSFADNTDGSYHDGPSEQLQHSLCQAIICHLPEVSLLFSIPTRFDPFEQHLGHSKSHSNALVVLQLCEAVQSYIGLDHSLMTNVKFDWTKLVPTESQEQDQGRVFSNAEPLLQHRILQMLIAVSESGQSSPFSHKMLSSVLSILVSTKIPEVYTAARKFALLLMEQEIFSDVKHSNSSSVEADEALQCNKYESSLWIDGISVDVIQELVTMIEESKQNSVQQKIVISQAWSKASMGYPMPATGTSPLLLFAICKLLGSGPSLSSNMSLLLVQIVTKMFLFMVDPKSLAALIVFCSQNSTPGDKHAASLCRVAKSILRNESPKTYNLLQSLVSDMFLLHESSLSCIFGMMSDEECTELDLSQCTDTIALRQCLNVMKYSGEQSEKLRDLTLNVATKVLEAAGESDHCVASRLMALFKNPSLGFEDLESTMILLQSKQLGSLLDYESTTKEDSVVMLLVSELMRFSSLSANNDNESLITKVWRFSLSALESNNTNTSNLRDFLFKIMMHTMPTRNELEKSSPLPPGEMFDLWSVVARNLTTTLAVDFCVGLEDYIAALFEDVCGQQAWIVYQRICSLTSETFVDLSMKTLLKRVESNGHGEPTLVSQVLQYDCSNFSCLSDFFIKIDADKDMMKLWDGGRLDHTAVTFVLQTCKQKSASDIIALPSFAKGAESIGRRFLDILTRQTSFKGETFGKILRVLYALCSKQFILHETQQCLLQILGHLENGTKVFAVEHEIQVMKLSVCVQASDKNRGPDTSLLLSKAFLRCCQVLPKNVKKMMRTKGELEIHCVESMIHTLSSLIGYVHTFDEKTITLQSDIIDSCIISCLKYGMMESDNEKSCSALGGCLKIICLLMEKSHRNESSKEFSLGSLTPSQVHAMAVSHSSFQSALSSSSGSSSPGPLVADENESNFCEGLTQQFELINLLLCTLSLNVSHVKVEKETLTAILSTYNASTSRIDRSIRRLLFLYENSGSCKDEIMMNDLRWGSMAAKHTDSVGEDESWEWFLDALELDRIRLTLSQFPVADTLVPVGTKSLNKKINHSKEHGLSDDSDVETDGDSNVSDAESNVQENTHGGVSLLGDNDDLWRGNGDDIRYSPGFILPLILATLEAHLPHEQENSSESLVESDNMSQDEETANNSEEGIAQRQAYGNICRRMADRGGIALAIASLSSRCPSIRKVAVSICALFLKALQMQESHEIKSWRERPQQEMIMASIQRGLAVRRALQIQKFENQDGIELGGLTAATHEYNIPMLPAVSAVFLAKVLLVLSRPSDDMYGQMNRYFLRLNDYHGAFQDCFGLPAFLSLYCSATDELSRCRTERNWALLTLKDSAVDPFCYRIISQHHVPELIMSSFDSLIDDPESKSELYLTIDVIETLIQSGGRHALDHLIKRQGILSWLHGIMSWRSVSSVFPYVALKCRFLKLVTTSVKSYACTKCSSDEESMEAEVFYEKIPLANMVIRICLDDGDSTGDGDDSSSDSSVTLLENTCGALWAIHLADKESQSNPQGLTTLGDMTSLLRKFLSHSYMFGRVLTCMCELPFVLGGESDLPSSKLFCELALGFILEMNIQLSQDTVLLSLKRVNELVQLHPRLGNETDIVHQVMKCRHIAASISGIQVWESLIPYLKDYV